MSEEPISPTPIQMSLWVDFPVSRSPMPATSEEPTTPDISGRKCLELSGNSGPLGLLEKTLLGSQNWAWTKYSLTWRPRATPRGRLIFQLARLAPRTSASASGLLHTPTAKANQTSPSMKTRGRGNWVSGLWPTPTAMTGGEDVAPSHLTGEHGWNTAAAVHSGLWPTPNARENGGGEYQDPEKIKARMAQGHQTNLGDAVKLWQTPVADDSVERTDGKWNSRGEPKLSAQVKLWPTPTVSDHKGSGPTVVRKDGKIRDDRLDYAVEQFWPTPSSQEPGWKNIEVVDRYGRPPTHLNQRFYDKKTGRLVQKGLEQTTQMFPTQASAAKRHRLGGTLNPRWVAWLMGYPPEYFDSVPWETPSSRRSRNK